MRCRALCLAVLAATGCDTVFGLEAHPRDAAPPDVAKPADAAVDGPADAALDGPPDTGLSAGCSVTYGSIGTQTTSYRYLTAQMSWKQAEMICEQDQVPSSSMHTHLAVIDNDAERSQLNALHAGIPIWIGLSDRAAEATYKWVTLGGPTLPAMGAPWAVGQPAQDTQLDCVQMNNTSDFVVDDCTQIHTAWCECDSDAVSPPNP